MAPKPRILDEILVHKRREVAAARERHPLIRLERQAGATPPPRDFAGALARPGLSLIAEIKRRSPSAGLIRASFRPSRIAMTYERHGAAAISVLTDKRFFGGSLTVLRHVRKATSLPLLRKDFVVDPYQVVEARAAGADAVLLIAEALTLKELRRLRELAAGLGLAALVEAHGLGALRKALDAGARIVGINNRDLRTFKTDLSTTRRLLRHIPEGKLVVSESAIRTREDAELVASWGVDAILVGETLVRRRRIGRAVDELLGRT